MSRVSVQSIVGYSSPSDRALVRDAGGEPRCDPAKIPKEIACLPCERSSSSPSKLSPCLHVEMTASPQAARMPVGRSIVPDSSEARGMSREAPSDAQQFGWVEAVDGASTSGLGSDFEPPEEFLAL